MTPDLRAADWQLLPELSLPPALAFALALLSGAAAGLVCYELLEKPLSALFKRRRRNSDASRAKPAINPI